MGSTVFMVSYALHIIAFKHRVLTPCAETFNSDTHNAPETNNSFLKKWLDFGGGFYGIVAFVKLIFIELKQIRDLFVNWQSMEIFTGGQVDIGFIFGSLFHFIFGQIENFVTAIIWPLNYLGSFSILESLLFFAVTYGLYLWARKLAASSLHHFITS